MVNHFTVALTTGTPINLAVALAGGAGVGNVLRFLSLQAHTANAAVAYVGGNQRTLTSTDFGYRIEVPVATIPYAPSVIELGGNGYISLGDFFVLGATNDELQILIVY